MLTRGLQRGLTRSLRRGLNPSNELPPVSWASLEEDGGPELARGLGFATSPTAFWLFNDASGAEEDLVGSVHLSPIGSPTQNVADGTLGVTVVQFGNGTISQGMQAAAGSSLDTATGSMMFLWIGRLTAVTVAGILAGKYDAIGNGWEVSGWTDKIRLTVKSAAGTVNRDLAGTYVTGAKLGILAVLDRTANEMKVHTWLDGASASSAASTPPAGSISNTSQRFIVGDNRGATTVGSRNAASAVWVNVDGMDGTHLATLMNTLYPV